MIWLGFDPGGARRFGVAILRDRGPGPLVRTAVVSCANEAAEWASKQSGAAAPHATGIDTLVFWSKAAAGWRDADKWLRDQYRPVLRSVQTPNRLQGSMLMQGMILAILLRRRWPGLKITETHPKILYYAKCKRKYDWPRGSVAMQTWLGKQLRRKLDLESEHEFDALMSAWAAREGFSDRWPRDLRKESSDDQVLEPAGTVHYWWPE